MQTTTAAWKAAHTENFLPPSSVEISYRITDPTADASVQSITSSDEAALSQLSETLSGGSVYNKYAVLEQNAWVLDGTFPIYALADIPDTGYISDSISDNSFAFTSPLVIDITFNAVQTNPIKGLTLQFSTAFGETADSFTIRAYNGGSLISGTQVNVTNNTELSLFVEDEIVNYDEITITVSKWTFPEHRARIEQIVLGEVKIFVNNDLISFTHTQNADLLSLALPENAIEFSIDNADGSFNPANPDGVYQYLVEKQEMRVKYGLETSPGLVEWIAGGLFYLTGANVPQNGIIATFTARDILTFAQTRYNPQNGTISLYNLAEDALLQSAIPKDANGNNRWNIDNVLTTLTVNINSDTFDEDITCAEVLQYCANAACCVMYQDRSGILQIKPYVTGAPVYAIDGFISYANAEYEITQPLKGVNVNNGMGAITVSASGETQEITNPLIQDGTRAGVVAAWVALVLQNRKLLSGEYRPDTATDVLDYVAVSNKYASENTAITSLTYSFNGAFRGNYEGRVM